MLAKGGSWTWWAPAPVAVECLAEIVQVVVSDAEAILGIGDQVRYLLQ